MSDRRSPSVSRRSRNGALTPRDLAPRPALPPLRGRRILIAEDEIIIAMELQASLEDAGACVIGPAHTLNEALRLATEVDLCAAILDLRLGGRSADAIAGVLTEREIPFLFYSGQSTVDPVRTKWSHIAAVTKPATSQALVNALVRLLDAHTSPSV